MMNRLAKRLDPRLDKVDVFHELTEAEALEFGFLDDALTDLENDMALTTTPARSIARKEGWYGVLPDESKPLSDRIAVIVAKHRGQGTTTPAFLRNVARSFQYGDINVDDESVPDTVVITFNDVMGIPPNLRDFEGAIMEVMPAHLLVNFIYRYLTWDMYEAYNKAWDEWEALGLTWDEMEVYDGK